MPHLDLKIKGYVVGQSPNAPRRPPVFPERLELETWCSGKAKTVAERSTTIRGEQGADVDAIAIWVHVDPESRLPARLPEEFERLYGPSAAGRRARSSLRHPAAPPDSAEQLEWTFGRSAIDFAGHVGPVLIGLAAAVVTLCLRRRALSGAVFDALSAVSIEVVPPSLSNADAVASLGRTDSR